MKTKVFVYKGVVGIESDFNAEGLLNDPSQPGQLGFVLDASQVQFSKEAVDALKKVKKSHDAIGEVDIFKSRDKVIFGFLGGPYKAFLPEVAEGSREYDASLITASEEPVTVPDEFMAMVDYHESMKDDEEDPDSADS